MADISFYKYLEAAFRYRLFNPQGQKASLETKFNYLGYNLKYERIFFYARRILAPFYRNEAQFPDTEEGNLQMAKAVINKLDKERRGLEDYSDAAQSVLDYELIVAEAKAESQQAATAQAAVGGQQAVTGEPVSTMTGGLPSLPSIPSAQRPVIRNVPQKPGGETVTTPQAKLYVADKSGRVVQERTVTPTSTTVRKPEPPPSKLYIADKSGTVVGERSIGRETIKPSTPQPRLHIANKSGAVVREHTIPASPGRFRALGGRIGRGFSSTLGSTVNGGMRFFGRAGNGAINAFVGLSNRASTGSLIRGSSKRVWLVILGSLIILVLGTTFTVPPSTQEGQPTATGAIGAGCPDTSTNKASCRYLNPSINLFNTAISSSAIDSYISKYSPIFINAGKGDLNEFKKRVNYIVTSSQKAGLNPSLFLGYWKSESRFSTVGSRDMGCVGDNFYEQVDCSLGINRFSDPQKNPIANCARSKDANSLACTALKSIRQNFDKSHPITYPIATFDNFAEGYGPYGHLVNGIPTNCTHTYNILVEVAKELNSCVTSPTPTFAGSNKIIGIASQITQLLSKGIDGFFNVKRDEPGVYYWCTYLIVDSYNRSGLSGLTRPNHAAVLAMKSFFSNTQGYKLLSPDTAVSNLRVGDVIFFEGSGNQHTSLIKSFDLEENGNGVIKTYDSNNIVIEDTVFVRNYRATKAQTTTRLYNITGFGQIAP